MIGGLIAGILIILILLALIGLGWDTFVSGIKKIPNDRLDGHIRSMIKNLEKRKEKAMIRSDTDDLWTKIETLQWVLYVIFAIKNERMEYPEGQIGTPPDCETPPGILPPPENGEDPPEDEGDEGSAE